MGDFVLAALGGGGQGFAQGKARKEQQQRELEVLKLRKTQLDSTVKLQDLQGQKILKDIEQDPMAFFKQVMGGQGGQAGAGQQEAPGAAPRGPGGLQMEGLTVGPSGPSVRFGRPPDPKLQPGTTAEFAKAMQRFGLDPTKKESFSQENVAAISLLLRQEKQQDRLDLERAEVKFEAEEKAKTPLPPFIQKLFGFKTIGEAQKGKLPVPKLDSPGMAKLGRSIASSISAANQIDVLDKNVALHPESFGFVGATAAAIEGFLAQVKNVLFALGANPTIEQQLGRLGPVFNSIGVRNRLMQSQILRLVVAVGRSEGFEGRALTDRKIELLRTIIGASTQSPDAFRGCSKFSRSA